MSSVIGSVLSENEIFHCRTRVVVKTEPSSSEKRADGCVVWNVSLLTELSEVYRSDGLTVCMFMHACVALTALVFQIRYLYLGVFRIWLTKVLLLFGG